MLRKIDHLERGISVIHESFQSIDIKEDKPFGERDIGNSVDVSEADKFFKIIFDIFNN